jgi:hypothetical protein
MMISRAKLIPIPNLPQETSHSQSLHETVKDYYLKLGHHHFSAHRIQIILPVPVAVRSEASTVFARLNAGIVGSNPIKTWMSVCVYSLCVFLCVRTALRRADPPSMESYRLCIRLRNRKSGQGPTKDCRV